MLKTKARLCCTFKQVNFKAQLNYLNLPLVLAPRPALSITLPCRLTPHPAFKAHFARFADHSCLLAEATDVLAH